MFKKILSVTVLNAILGSGLFAQITLPASAQADAQKLGQVMTKFLGNSLAKSVPFTAASANYAPYEYHFLIPVIDLYVSGPAVIGASKVDLGIFDDPAYSGLAGISQIKSSLAPFSTFAYLPVPTFAIAAHARLQLPIPVIKDIELMFKFGFIPSFAQDLLQGALKGVPGIKLDIRNDLIGFGARYRLLNTGIFKFGFDASYNHLSGNFNIAMTTPKQTIGDYTSVPSSPYGVLKSDMTIAVANKYDSSVLALGLDANVNLFILQIYGGLGLNWDLTPSYNSSYSITGTLYNNDVSQGNLLSISEIIKTGSGVLTPKFALGLRLLILDIQAESTFDLKTIALRAAVALSI
jgi:hypothetical protein